MRDDLLSDRVEATQSVLPRYEPPRIKLIDEEEVLSTFQITQAGYTWWIA